MPNVPEMPISERAMQAGQRQQVKVIIGGALVTEVFTRQIGSDGYAPDASWAVALASVLLAW
jgi:5-methyltetrahydrofolate--homocysteine methyltransferase